MKFQQKPYYNDPRSLGFSHAKLFGTVAPKNLPTSLLRPRPVPYNQMNTTRCTGYGSAQNGYHIHHVYFNPDWQAAKIGEKQGYSVDNRGGDPNATMKVERDNGFLPVDRTSINLEQDGIEGSGWDKFPTTLDADAEAYTVAGFVKVDSSAYDTFDAIKSALFMAYDPTTQTGACVQAFGKWYTEWTYARIIPKYYGDFAGYHHYLFIDFVEMSGTQYLVAQNSYGPYIGDGGYHYFPREVVNKEFNIPGTTLKICKALTTAQVSLAKTETPAGRIQRIIAKMWYTISNFYLN